MILKYQLVMFQFPSFFRKAEGGKRILKVSTYGVSISEFRPEGGRQKKGFLKVSTVGSLIFEFHPEDERRKSIFSAEMTILVAVLFYQWRND